MSVNWVTLDSNREPIPLQNEEFVYKSVSYPNLTLPISVKNLTSAPGSSDTTITCTQGSLYLSTQRLVYIPDKSASSKFHVTFKASSEGSSDSRSELRGVDRNFESIAIPLKYISNAKLQQPWIGANSWIANFMPVPNGGLDTPAQIDSSGKQTQQNVGLWEIKITFSSGGAIDFYTVFGKAMQARSMEVQHIDELPAYSPM